MTALEPIACRSYVANVTAYLEAEVDEEVATAFEQHTVVCDGCARYLEQTRTAVSLLSGRAAFPAPPPIQNEPPAAAVPAYKFLATGRVAPFTGFVWREGEWVSIIGPARPCRRGVHACRVSDLPYWINDELWLVELAEPVLTARDKLVSVGGRLERRVAEWNDEAARGFASYCAGQARNRAVDALNSAGFGGLAAPLMSASDQDVAAEFERLAGGGPASVRASCEYGAEAFRSLADSPMAAAVGAAYMAVLAAAHADGPRASVDERRDQALWLQRELGLTDAGA